MEFEIRRAQHFDAAKIIESHRRSIREVCSKDYNQQQIAVWSGRNFRDEVWQQTMDTDFVWVISNSRNDIYGFGHLKIKLDKQAVVAGLYFIPEVMGKGFGKKLIELIILECRQQGVKNVTLSSTITAKSFYEKMGFQCLGDLSSVEIGGEKIDCYEMKITLS